MDGFACIWPPSRTQIDGVSIGDAWECSDLPRSPPAQPWESIVPGMALSSSIGVTAYRRGEGYDAMFRRANHALYEAKRHGRNQVLIA